MVLLVERISKLCSKLENHHHRHHHQQEEEALSASLQAFRSSVSSSLNQLLIQPGSGSLSILWIQQCFKVFPMINQAFAKLVVEIEYPTSTWEAASAEEYLNYSLCLLDLLNCISSSLSHLGQARLELSHALSLVEDSGSPSLALDRLKAIKLQSSSKELKLPQTKVDSEERFISGKERVIHQAILEIKSIGFWVCGIVLSGLSGDSKLYLQIKQLAGGFASSSWLSRQGSGICEVRTGERVILEEVKELKDAVAGLAAAIATGDYTEAAEELKTKSEAFEKALEDLGKRVDQLFSKTLRRRSQLLDTSRQESNSNNCIISYNK